jgi:hypothetical protein
MKSIEFIQLVSLVASQMGCMVEMVDGTTININCPGGKQQEVLCAQAIEEATDGIIFDEE